MNIKDKRFKVTSLIQLARTTTNDDRRERYVAEAEDVLNSMETNYGSSMEKFFYDLCVPDENEKIDRTIVYSKYVDFCKKNKLEVYTRNALYYFLRENSVCECKIHGTHNFKMKILNDPINQTESGDFDE